MDSAVEGSILLLGDGDFSLSRALLNYNSPDQMTSTSFETEYSVQKHKDALTNRDLLIKDGVEVLFDIDACSLENYHQFKEKYFKRIIFNFPHVGGKSNHKKNRNLLNEFFNSAVTVLHPRGHVMLTLCKGQGGTPADRPQRAWHDSWQVVSMAANAGLLLSEIHPFRPEDFPGYFCTGFRSQDKWFHIDGALTHVFTRSEPIHVQDLAELSEHITSEIPPCFRRNFMEEDGHPLRCLFAELVEKFKLVWSTRVSSLSDILSKLTPLSPMEEVISLLEEKLTSSDDIVLSLRYYNNKDNSRFPSVPVCWELVAVFRYNKFSSNLQKLETLLSELFVSSLSKTEIKIQEQLPVSSSETKNRLIVSYVIFVEIDNVITEIGKIFMDSIGSTVCITLNLIQTLCSLCNLSDPRLLWSTDDRFLSQFSLTPSVRTVQFVAFSLYPVRFCHDMSFWENQDVKFDESKYYRIIQNIASGVVKDVKLKDVFCDGDRTSRCYRLVFQSCDRALSYKVSWRLQSVIRLATAKLMGIKLR